MAAISRRANLETGLRILQIRDIGRKQLPRISILKLSLMKANAASILVIAGIKRQVIFRFP
jgi:hypothetical protein